MTSRLWTPPLARRRFITITAAAAGLALIPIRVLGLLLPLQMTHNASCAFGEASRSAQTRLSNYIILIRSQQID